MVFPFLSDEKTKNIFSSRRGGVGGRFFAKRFRCRNKPGTIRQPLIRVTKRDGRIFAVHSRRIGKVFAGPWRYSFAGGKREECNGAWKAEWWSVSMSAHRGGIGYCFGPLFPKQTASTLFRQEICSARQAGRTGNGLLSVLLFVINTGSRRRFSLQRAHNSRAVSIAAEHRTVKIF